MTHRKKDQAGKPLAEVIADGFPAFLFRCGTLDPSRTEPRKIEPIPFIRKFAEKLTSEPRLIVVKSRQMMASWIGCAYILFRALSTGAGIHLVLSKEERSAKELIERMRFLLESLSIDHSELGTSTITGTIAFRNLGSRIISLPASPYAVRGLSPRTVFWDEMAFTPNDEEIWAAVKPAVDSGGSFLGVSTPNGPSGVLPAWCMAGRKDLSSTVSIIISIPITMKPGKKRHVPDFRKLAGDGSRNSVSRGLRGGFLTSSTVSVISAPHRIYPVELMEQSCIAESISATGNLRWSGWRFSRMVPWWYFTASWGTAGRSTSSCRRSAAWMNAMDSRRLISLLPR